MTRVVRLLLALALLCSGAAAGVASAATGRPALACVPRTLVLSAMPIELGPLLARTDGVRVVDGDVHNYYVGRLRGQDVVLTLTGIGPVNAARSTTAALKRFRCGDRSGISRIVFSGVAGGDYIGDVIVPDSWTLDAGKHVVPVDSSLLATARRVAAAHVHLERTAPAGDPACGCVTSPDAVPTIAVTHRPRIEVGGTGQTTDPFAGRALGCAPGGGDVFGCEPCAAQTDLASTTPHFAQSAVPFVNPSFFSGYASSSKEDPGYVAEDEETAAVATVAARAHVPFLGFRAVSDGKGDPLGLPGFPFQFFYYRQISADNAATTTLAFLSAL